MYHIITFKRATNIVMSQKKVGFQLTLKNLISIFKNVVTLNKKQQLSKTAIELVKLYFSGLDKSQFVTQFYGLFKNLVKADQSQSLLSNQTLLFLTDILTSSQHTDLGLLNTTVMKKICKKFNNADNSEALKEQQIAELFFIIQDFYPSVIGCAKQSKTISIQVDETFQDVTTFFTEEEFTDLLNLSLWVLEQSDVLDVELKSHLFLQIWANLLSVLQKDSELKNLLILNKETLEAILARWFAIGNFDSVAKLLKVFYNKSIPENFKKLEENLKAIKEVLIGLSSDVLSFAKNETSKNQNSILGHVIDRKQLDDSKIVEIFTFLIDQSAEISKVEEKIKAKKQEQKSKDATEAYNPRKDMSNMTPEEVAVHRSISISSQKHEAVDVESSQNSLLIEITDFVISNIPSSKVTEEFFASYTKSIFNKSIQAADIEHMFTILVSGKMENHISATLFEKVITQGKEFFMECIDDLKAAKSKTDKVVRDELLPEYQLVKRFSSDVLSTISCILLMLCKEDSPKTFFDLPLESVNFLSVWIRLIATTYDLYNFHSISKNKELFLTKSAILNIAKVTGFYLANYCNFGYHQGFSCVQRHLLPVVEITIKFANILAYAVDSTSN